MLRVAAAPSRRSLWPTPGRPSRQTFAPKKCPVSSSSFMSCAVVPVLAALWLSAAGSIAVAQNEAAPPPKDTIFARKIMMGTIDMNMDEVETMLAPGGKLDHTDAREHLDIISVLLMAFPHM